MLINIWLDLIFKDKDLQKSYLFLPSYSKLKWVTFVQRSFVLIHMFSKMKSNANNIHVSTTQYVGVTCLENLEPSGTHWFLVHSTHIALAVLGQLQLLMER